MYSTIAGVMWLVPTELDFHFVDLYSITMAFQ